MPYRTGQRKRGTMTYYYRSKTAAHAALDEVRAAHGGRIQHGYVSLEPDNGWVMVVVPKVVDITDLGDTCEVRMPSSGTRLTGRPAQYKRYTHRPKARMVRKPVPPPAVLMARPTPPPPAVLMKKPQRPE